jgi:hypothetical protein
MHFSQKKLNTIYGDVRNIITFDCGYIPMLIKIKRSEHDQKVVFVQLFGHDNELVVGFIDNNQIRYIYTTKGGIPYSGDFIDGVQIKNVFFIDAMAQWNLKKEFSFLRSTLATSF